MSEKRWRVPYGAEMPWWLGMVRYDARRHQLVCAPRGLHVPVRLALRAADTVGGWLMRPTAREQAAAAESQIRAAKTKAHQAWEQVRRVEASFDARVEREVQARLRAAEELLDQRINEKRLEAKAIRLREQAEWSPEETDFAEAAGEFLVPMPEPGTPTAKLLSANVLLRRDNARLAAIVERLPKTADGVFRIPNSDGIDDEVWAFVALHCGKGFILPAKVRRGFVCSAEKDDPDGAEFMNGGGACAYLPVSQCWSTEALAAEASAAKEASDERDMV